MLRVGNDDLTRIHQRCWNVARQKSSRCDHARQALAKGNHVVGGARRKLTDRGNSSQQFVQRIELFSQLSMQLGMQAGVEQLAGDQVMALAEMAANVERLFAVTSSRSRGHGEQLVGHLSHGAYDHEGAFWQTRFHDRRDAIDGGRIFHGRAAELHHDHGFTTSQERGSARVTTRSLAP